MHFLSLVVGSLVLVPFVSGCIIKNCSAADCDSGISVTMLDMPEAHSRLVITLTVDNVATVCSSISDGVLASSGGEGGASTSHAQRPEITCKGPLADSIRFDDNDGASFLVRETPDNARLKMEVDGAILLDKDLDPQYQTERPNGPGCAPKCEVAEYRLSLASE